LLDKKISCGPFWALFTFSVKILHILPLAILRILFSNCALQIKLFL